MNKINYQKELDKLIDELQLKNKVPKLLLHSCCAPCSSYVLEYLSKFLKANSLAVFGLSNFGFGSSFSTPYV